MTKDNKNYDLIFGRDGIDQIRTDYINGMSYRELYVKYNITSHSWLKKALNGIIRSRSESAKVAFIKYPNAHKHTEESKAKLREAHIKYMKEHPENTAWRKRNKPSYPEQCFIKYLTDRGYDKKYRIEREKSFFPYYADFAFLDIHLVVEIDGSQHISDPVRVENDKKKDELLNSLGWKVIRYTEHTVKYRWDLIDETLLLDNHKRIEEHSVVGIYRIPGGYKKVKRDENGYSEKQKEAFLRNRKCEWPDKNTLLTLIKSKSFTEIGRMYGGVDGNAVKKWCKHYGLPHLRSEIKKMYPSG